MADKGVSVTNALDKDLYAADSRAGYRTELIDEEEDDQLETIRCVLMHAAVLGAQPGAVGPRTGGPFILNALT